MINHIQNEVFCHNFEFRSLVFLELECSDRLQQCLTSGRGKTYKKLCLKLGFSPFSKFDSLVFLEIAYNHNLQECLTPSGSKLMKKHLGPNLDQNQS